MIPFSPEAYDLMHQGTIALAKVEANGMRIDVPYLKSALAKTQARIKRKQELLNNSKVTKIWRKRFKTRTNFGSREQLGKILFEDLGFKCPDLTATGRYSTDEETLAKVDHPFVRRILSIEKLKKGVQFLKGIHEETCEGFLHPNFNLHLVKTFRSSSSEPNFQNMPVRNKWMKELVRRCVVARKGRRLVEIDYKGIEVCIACCYHQDPMMQKYIEDPTKDMHRDMAMECYLLEKDEVSKDSRYCAKNKFVFPEFYGAWWFDCSAALWDAIRQLKLTTVSGISLLTHLKAKGIKELGDQDRKNRHPRPGTFEAHIQKVERKFWDKRFPVYAQWKKDWYDEYLEKGWFLTKTGFICQGYMARNDVINYPVQGSAFHCLLWALTQLVNKELRRAKMKALVVGQIHDSMVNDVPDEEVDDFCALAKEVMVTKLREAWDWITTPLTIEIEVTPVGGSWYEKEERK